MLEDSIMTAHEIKAAEENNIKIEYYTMDGTEKAIYMCPGDLMYICNVLIDYARIFEAFCLEAEEQGEGWKKYTYEYYLIRCRKIQGKIESAIGYSTEAAIEQCRKKNKKSERDEDVGENALVLTLKHMKKKQQQKEAKRTAKTEKEDTALKKNDRNTDSAGIVGQVELADFLKS